jgi:hypothetical protein
VVELDLRSKLADLGRQLAGCEADRAEASQRETATVEREIG